MRRALILGVDPVTGCAIEYRGDGHVMVVARPGSWKSRGICIPNLLRLLSSVIVIDPNNELTIATALFRRFVLGHTEIHIVDPYHVVPDHILPVVNGKLYRATFDPISYILAAGPDDAATRSYIVADAIIVGDKHMEYWTSGGRTMLVAFLLHVALDPYYDSCPDNRTISEVWRLLNSPSDIDMALACMAESDDMHRVAIAESLIEAPKDDREQRSIKNTIKTNCSRFLSDIRIVQCMKKSSIDFFSINKRPMSVYIVLPGHLAKAQMRFLRLFINCANSEIERGGRIAYDSAQGPTLLMAEEFASLGNFPELTDAAARLRGSGLQLMFILQSFSQLVNNFGPGWENLLGSLGVVEYHGGTADKLSYDRISELIGKTTIQKESRGSGHSGQNASSNVTVSSESWPVLMPDQVANLRMPQQTVTFIGEGTILGEVIHPSLRAFPAYQTFQQYFNAGYPPEEAAEMARLAASQTSRQTGQVEQVRPSQPKRKRKSLWGLLDSAVASLLGDEKPE